MTEFESALPSDATKKSITSMEGFSDSPYEAYKFEPTESLELSPGDVLAVMIDIEGVTATFKNPHTTVDHFGAFINKDRMALIEVSSVAKRDPAIYDYSAVPDTTTPDNTADEAPVWSPLVAEANADIYPSFAWTVPTNAAIGSKFQLQIIVNKGSSTTLLKDNYYGVFQVTVTAPPPPPPVEEEPEDSVSSLLITIAIVTAATAVSVACLYFFVI